MAEKSIKARVGEGRTRWVSALAWSSVAVALAGSVFFGMEIRGIHERSETVAHIVELTRALRISREGMQMMESGQRGFLLTRDEAYLGDYEAGIFRAKDALMRYEGMAGARGRGVDVASAKRLRGLYRQKRSELAETVDLARQGRHAEALAIVETGRGKRYMEDFSQIMQGRLTDLRREQYALQSRTAEELRVLVVAFMAWAAAIAFAMGSALWREGRARSRAQALSKLMEHEALRDVLTGLPNRRRLFDWLDAEMPKARLEGSELCILYLDLDGFSEINNKHGHKAGDQALIAASEAFKTCLGPADLLARLGGDEFVAVCPRCAIACAALVGEAMVAAVASLEPVGPGSRGRLGVSVGIADTRGVEVERALALADAAMYEAKSSGKSCVRIDPGQP